jgi:hypothetical protein
MTRPITTATIPNISNALGCALIKSNGGPDGQMPLGMAVLLHMDEPILRWTLVVSNRYERWELFLLEAANSKDVIFGYD